MTGLSVVPDIIPAVEPVTMIEAAVGQVRKRDRHGVHHAHQVHVDGVDEVHRVGLPMAMGRMPALATTMSSRPKLRDTSLERIGELVTLPHVCLTETIRRSNSSTARAGLGQVLGGGQRIGVGLDLPADVHRDDVGTLFGQADGVTPALPSGAPVMKATFPSRRPGMFPPQTRRSVCTR